MPVSRVAGLLLCSLAAPSLAARIHQAALQHEQAEATVESFLKTGIWLTESCQDYPEASGFGLGDTVRIHKPDSHENNHVGVVGCQDPAKPGQVCLEGLKGCYDLEELRPINTLVFTFYTIGGTVSQIFGAIKSDVEDAWEDIKMGLTTFASSVSNKITDARAKISDKIAEARAKPGMCDASKAEESEKGMEVAEVKTKSRLAMLVDSAVQRWGNLKEGIKAAAVSAKAKLVKIAKYLSEKLSEFYDAHLKETVEALQRYLSGIAAAVTDVPDELNPLAGGEEVQAREVQEEPSGLSKAIEGFMDKVGELGAKIVELSKAAYDKVKAGLGALMSGAGRLIAAASQKFASAMATVKRLAGEAVEKMKQWGRDAVEWACNFDVKETAKAAWESIKEGFRKAVDAVKRGYTYVKETLQETAASLAAMVSTAAVTIKETSVAVYESDAVQNTLAVIKEEIRVLKELIKDQASLVGKFVGGFMRYFGRFIPSWVKNKFKTAAQKAKELATKIKERISELMSKVTAGEADHVDVDEDAATVDV